MPLNKSAALLMGVAREGRELALLLVPAPRWLPAASVSQLTAAAADYYAAAVPPMPQHVNAAEPSTQLGSSFAIPSGVDIDVESNSNAVGFAVNGGFAQPLTEPPFVPPRCLVLPGVVVLLANGPLSLRLDAAFAVPNCGGGVSVRGALRSIPRLLSARTQIKGCLRQAIFFFNPRKPKHDLRELW